MVLLSQLTSRAFARLDSAEQLVTVGATGSGITCLTASESGIVSSARLPVQPVHPRGNRTVPLLRVLVLSHATPGMLITSPSPITSGDDHWTNTYSMYMNTNQSWAEE